MEKYIIFQSNNTPSIDIAGTAVVKAIHKQYPDRKIIVTTNFPEIWLHNPNVYRVYRLDQTPYFYSDFVENKDSLIFAHDPTKEKDYVNKEKHIIETWCDMCGVKYNGELPSLHFTQRESEVSERLTKSDRPLFFIQPFEMFGPTDTNGWCWPKNIPVLLVGEIVRKMTQAGYLPVLIKNQNQPSIMGATNLQLNLRQTLAALQFSQKNLFIDSFLQAASVAVGKSSIVTWLSTNPKNNGYELNDNLIMKVDENLKESIDSYNPVFDFDNRIINKPVDTDQAFSSEEILNALLK